MQSRGVQSLLLVHAGELSPTAASDAVDADVLCLDAAARRDLAAPLELGEARAIFLVRVADDQEPMEQAVDAARDAGTCRRGCRLSPSAGEAGPGPHRLEGDPVGPDDLAARDEIEACARHPIDPDLGDRRDTALGGGRGGDRVGEGSGEQRRGEVKRA